MTKRPIPRSLRRQLLADSRSQCAYCHTLTAITGARLVIDHITPETAGGKTVWLNLCAACHSCNEFKAGRFRAQDPLTGMYVRLFHPRRNRWKEHFRWSRDGTTIIGTTPIGRATVVALNMNHHEVVQARRRWVAVGWHPPVEDV